MRGYPLWCSSRGRDGACLARSLRPAAATSSTTTIAVSMDGKTSSASIDSHALEERVTERAVVLRRPVEVANALVEALRGHQAGLERGGAHAFDHRRERLAREAVDELWATGV